VSAEKDLEADEVLAEARWPEAPHIEAVNAALIVNRLAESDG
jgi:hypothetical protein